MILNNFSKMRCSFISDIVLMKREQRELALVVLNCL
jgi:hypothetical protein